MIEVSRSVLFMDFSEGIPSEKIFAVLRLNCIIISINFNGGSEDSCKASHVYSL